MPTLVIGSEQRGPTTRTIQNSTMSQVTNASEFPHEESYAGHTVTVYAERDRASIRFRYTGPDGQRTKLQRVPLDKHLIAIPADGIVPAHVIRWAQQVVGAKAAQTEATTREIEEARGRPNHIRYATLTEQIRASAWYKGKDPRARRELDKVLDWVGAVLGRSFMLSDYDENQQSLLLDTRTAASIKIPSPRGGTKLLRPCGFNAARQQLSMLATATEMVKFVKVQGRRLLSYNPFKEDARLPPFKERMKRERVLPDRFAWMLGRADRVDPTGRFRVMLAIDRWIGIRPSTIVPLRRSDILITPDAIEEALWELHPNARPVPDEKIKETAQLFAASGGAIYLDRNHVKQARSGQKGVAQYDRIVPMGPALGWEVGRYLRDFWTVFDLPEDGPLLPMDEDTSRSFDRGTPQKWWVRVEGLIREDGIPLRKLRNTRWSGFRQQRIYELRAAGIPSKEIYYTVGWSVEQGGGSPEEGQLNVAEGTYLKVNPEILIRASQIGEGNTVPSRLRAVV